MGLRKNEHDRQMRIVDRALSGDFNRNVPPPITPEEAMAQSPEAKAAIDGMVSKADRDRFYNGLKANAQRGAAVDPALSYKRFGDLKGLYKSNPTEFLQKTENPWILGLNAPERSKIIGLRAKAEANPFGDEDFHTVLRYLNQKYGAEMTALGVGGHKTKANEGDIDAFNNNVSEAIDAVVQKEGRRVTRDDVDKYIAPQVLKHSFSGPFFWRTEEVPAWKQAIPDDFKEKWTKKFESRGVTAPTTDEGWRRIYSRVTFEE